MPIEEKKNTIRTFFSRQIGKYQTKLVIFVKVLGADSRTSLLIVAHLKGFM